MTIYDIFNNKEVQYYFKIALQYIDSNKLHDQLVMEGHERISVTPENIMALCAVSPSFFQFFIGLCKELEEDRQFIEAMESTPLDFADGSSGSNALQWFSKGTDFLGGVFENIIKWKYGTPDSNAVLTSQYQAEVAQQQERTRTILIVGGVALGILLIILIIAMARR